MFGLNPSVFWHVRRRRSPLQTNLFRCSAFRLCSFLEFLSAERDKPAAAFRDSGYHTRAKLLDMSRREEWQKVLEAEVKRWSALSCEQLVSELNEVKTYEVELDSKQYQVEVELLENTARYLHVMVAVDDGSLPASITPLTRTFICPKPAPTI